jgi:hypothetical protein
VAGRCGGAAKCVRLPVVEDDSQGLLGITIDELVAARRVGKWDTDADHAYREQILVRMTREDALSERRHQFKSGIAAPRSVVSGGDKRCACRFRDPPGHHDGPIEAAARCSLQMAWTLEDRSALEMHAYRPSRGSW